MIDLREIGGTIMRIVLAAVLLIIFGFGLWAAVQHYRREVRAMEQIEAIERMLREGRRS
jgi:hypothetical protein